MPNDHPIKMGLYPGKRIKTLATGEGQKDQPTNRVTWV